MAIRAINLAQFYKFIPNPRGWNGRYELDFSDIRKKWKRDTFIAIFSPGNADTLRKFEAKSNEYKLVFKNERKAINRFHPGPGRNTVVIFELK